ncbi:hypothetical protein DACRYDRAFT_63093 [Dacryopinax primogenitus]|uniref:Uncharacterized protein n=1 Tax=Dacryopinax primogenitus (strain DJM 731) TaxID=1858805 RepID=M5G9D9_DACPD|nr:uncharacterized protein DACRYDRAFT_63093 [Dacryopinax primogenitus]EJU04845.1 hypothetical protein DACRYDRAFT_63093 [Dacryopinax primogenitus]
MGLLPHSLLLLLLSIPLQTAAAGLGTVPINGTCNILNNGLDPDTHRFVTDCDATGYCTAQGTCQPKGCRRDVFAFGYGSTPQPPFCPDGTFCPDEEDACQPLLAVGKPCQLDRDDECAPPPNWQDLSSSMNSNGSICLSFVCQYQNATLGSACMVENVAYTGFESSGATFVQVVSRDNCKTPQYYCDGVQRVCLHVKPVGQACTGNKECGSYHCENGVCDLAPGVPREVSAWEYVVTGIGILAVMTGTLVGLWILHRRQRDSRRAEIAAYWREQTSYRNSLFALHHAHPTLSRPNTMYALAPTTPSVSSFTDTDTLRGREGWTMSSEESKVDLVGGSTVVVTPADDGKATVKETGPEKRRDWTALI